MRTHFTWSIEVGREKCPTCDRKTILVIAPTYWRADQEDCPEEDDIEVHDEVTGHYCESCERLVSLSLNTVAHDG